MSILEQVKDQLRSIDGGFVLNQWVPVTVHYEGRSLVLDALYPADHRANIRLRRVIRLGSLQYSEVLRFTKSGNLETDSLELIPENTTT